MESGKRKFEEVSGTSNEYDVQEEDGPNDLSNIMYLEDDIEVKKYLKSLGKKRNISKRNHEIPTRSVIDNESEDEIFAHSSGYNALNTTSSLVLIDNQEHEEHTCCNACRSKLDTILATVNRQQELLMQLLESQSGRTGANVMKEQLTLLPEFPLDARQSIVIFDHNLKNADVVHQFTQYMSAVGGKDHKDYVRRIMSKIMTDKVAKQFTWTGATNNTVAVNLMTFPSIIRAVVQNKFACTEVDVQKTIAEWLRRCTDRISYRQKQQVKQKHTMYYK